ncbi:MAG: hypothetical protein HN383_06620 [Verrucomicrobia bacterium]|jgi:uncharacterized HAD superfamily protein|nr:hypothetical protein [Verrucomicrobiota bacterium]MBT7699458.1 hypothetical protein [Verrucomicrobiota bacterium]
MKTPLVYIDFDDVLCQTAHTFIDVVEREFGRRYAFEDIRFFNLEKSFHLTPQEYDTLMALIHDPGVLRIMPPMPGVLDVLNNWQTRGVRTIIVTGRPPATEPVCHEWLEQHRVPYERVVFVDKYSRDHADHPNVQLLSPHDIKDMGFSMAVEDAPAMVQFLVEHTAIPIALLDRPWNRELGFSHEAMAAQITRCHDWPAVAEHLSELAQCSVSPP